MDHRGASWVKIMLKRIEFRAGASRGSIPLAFETAPSVTVFVGPNNSGKSQALQDLTRALSGKSTSTLRIINGVEFEEFTEADADRIIASNTISIQQQAHGEQRLLRTPTGDPVSIATADFRGALLNPNSESYRNTFGSNYVRNRCISMHGHTRMSLVESQSFGDLKNPTNSLNRLFVDDQKRARLRKVIFEALNLYLALDFTKDQKIGVRFGKTPPPAERNITEELIEYMREALPIEGVSDGVRAFTGMLIQIYGGEPEIILVDEPEAFLHPALAYTLGREVAREASEGRKFVFAATHSSHFLMGAIASGAKVNVIRLTYDGTAGTARLLPNDELVRMMRKPLLRSVGILEALFHSHVVVTEADTDRAFYHEINQRLLSAGDERGIAHALFLNATGIHTIPSIMGALRKLGIPAAEIADIDFLGVKGGQIADQLASAFIPQSERHSYRLRMNAVYGELLKSFPQDITSDETKAGQWIKTNGGLRLLSGQALETAENLVDDLGRYGIFVVPHGEVENWLETLEIKRSKSKWLQSIFESMGEDPDHASYVRPSNGDVWDFMGKVKSWLADGSRRGTI